MERTRGELFALCHDMGIKTSASDTKIDLILKLEGDPTKADIPLIPDGKLKLGGDPPKQADKPLIPEGKLMTLEGKKINGKKYRVTIFSTEQDKSDVVMSVNGYAIKIQRNKEVILDQCWVEVLQNSMISTVDQDPETMAMNPVTRLTYPHQAIPV